MHAKLFVRFFSKGRFVQTLDCSRSDVDGDSLDTAFTWTNITTGSIIGSSSYVVLTTSSASPGDEIECSVVVTDSISATASGAASVILENRLPSMSTVSISPNTAVSTSETLTCAAAATDPDEGSLSVVYTWTNTSTGDLLGSGSTLTLTPALVSPADVVECTASASDAEGESASDPLPPFYPPPLSPRPFLPGCCARAS